MLLILNVFQNSSAARLYAIADAGEKGFAFSRHLIVRQIQISHNAKTTSLTRDEFRGTTYLDDPNIVFYSKVSFNDFCIQFKASPYNQSKNYNYLKHNCASAANYALKLAGIDLQFGMIKRTSWSANPLFRIPTTYLTPIDLFHAAKKYKTQYINKSSIPFKIELASSALNFWAKSSKSQALRQKAESLVKEVKGSIKTKQHRAELYLEALMKSLDTRMSVKFAGDQNKYDDFLNQFKNRGYLTSTFALDLKINFTAGMVLSFLLSWLIDYSIPVEVVVLFVFLEFATMAYLQHAASNESKEHNLKTSQETKISLALSDFFEVARDNEVLDEQQVRLQQFN